jgi:methionyl-tRNA formyltransferase
MDKKPNIAFFGTPEHAVWTLDALKEKGIVPDLIIAAPDAPKGRKLIMTPPPTKLWGESNGIPVLQPEKIKTPDFEEKLRSYGTWDLFIVASYGKIIPENILYLPQAKTINVHPSLLPLLRGPSPLQGAILADMRDTGVTVMRLDKEMDHGPILAQKKITLDAWPIDKEALGKILFKEGAYLISEILPNLLSGKIKEIEQDHSRATYTKKITKSEGELDLNGDGYQNFLKYNAYKDWPGTFFFDGKNGKRSRITIAAASFENGKFIPKRVIPEGKKEMSWEEYRRNTR